MKFMADLHIHSRYSRATSPDLTLENLWVWGQKKGLGLIGTGDCVHPLWLKEIGRRLELTREGFLGLKPRLAGRAMEQVPESCRAEIRFVLSTEISCIYKKNGKVRKVHNVIIFSSLAAAQAFQRRMAVVGNIKSDGRPILGLDAKDLLAVALECDPQVLFIPAHIWTPWFSVLGAKSGFDSIQECFEDLTPHIFALETGLSSDPTMNGRLSQLDNFILVSNSDAHSASKLGREANCFDTDFSYAGMYLALADRNDTGFKGTIEFFPHEGKYYLDGHRACKVSLHPAETAKYKGLCPKCGGAVTAGVLSRVEALADRSESWAGRARVYSSVIPLEEILAEVLGVGKQSKKVITAYHEVINQLGPELSVLMDVPLKAIEKLDVGRLAEAIGRMREGQVSVTSGYDGEYGLIKCLSDP